MARLTHCKIRVKTRDRFWNHPYLNKKYPEINRGCDLTEASFKLPIRCFLFLWPVIEVTKMDMPGLDPMHIPLLNFMYIRELPNSYKVRVIICCATLLCHIHP